MKLALIVGSTALCAVSFAQYSDNFESETGSAAGTLITNGFGGTGQNGWYNPLSGSVDGSVYTYAGNALGMVANPNGSNQFLGMNVTTANGTVRSQHDVSFAAGGVWTIGFDFNGRFVGTPPAADNLGSVSLQPSGTSNYFQTIYQWASPIDNTANASNFSANIGHFAAAGGAIVFDSPGAAWQSLPVNHWYHQTVTWDFGTGLILDTTLADLTAGGPVNDFQPTGWYLAGGASNVGALAAPTAVRFFASGAAGDEMGYDNLTVTPVPEPATIVLLAGGLALLRKRRAR